MSRRAVCRLALLFALMGTTAAPVVAQQNAQAKPAAAKKADGKAVPGKPDAVSGLVLFLMFAFFVGMCGIMIWCLKFFFFGYSGCTWDHLAEQDPGHRPGPFPPYFEAETWPGLFGGGRLYRVYRLSDRVLAIEYGQAGLQRTLKSLRGAAAGAAGAVGMVHASREVQKILRRMHYLDQQNEGSLIDLATHDKNSFTARNEDIQSFELAQKPFRKVLHACVGKVTLKARNGTRVWTFMDRNGYLNAENFFAGSGHANVGRGLTAAFASRPAPAEDDVIALTPAARRGRF